jgi:hypothetical protein
MLLQSGADKTIHNKTGETIFELLQEEDGDLLQLLKNV